MPGEPRSIRTYSEGDRRIEARLGDRFVIELSGIPGAGYEWSLTQGPQVQLTNREVVPPSDIGGGALYRFHLTAAATGTHPIHAQYRRAWEARAHRVAAFQLTVSE